jgi:hypothetical protein
LIVPIAPAVDAAPPAPVDAPPAPVDAPPAPPAPLLPDFELEHAASKQTVNDIASRRML